ncbi:UDP-N-acetylmuramoyl-tripeptide--D-alanyl-D-alanine ligase [Melioribacteraceae bacterium 4301-Me]|uniref:UDP-N-acetylmuramoyl-tripeptide--D-alanyl-D- alanine ligase n=1 Tax=Pyranulibacter aquaticus TaxID=3163344 RepID=UPI00359BD56A
MSKLKITLEDLLLIPGAKIHNEHLFVPTSLVSIDSRNIEKGAIFFAIKGQKFDGHDFIKEAVRKDAVAVVLNEDKINDLLSLNVTLIIVPDTTVALGELAKIWRNKLSAKVVALTGSNGKTTTKELIAHLLAQKFKVVKTEANNNNHIGVPLTIFSADDKTEVLVLELGTNHFGEIPYTASIAQPDYALITNIGDSHLEFFGNRENVYAEKSAIFEETIKRGGKIFVNYDDPIIKSKTKNLANKITYGFRGMTDYRGKIVSIGEFGETKISIGYNNKKIEVSLPVYGKSNAENFLSAATVALELGLNKTEIINAAKKLKPPEGRLNVKIKKKIVLIDDTYNANPDSVKAAVDLVERIKVYKKKILILGDMLELGEASPKLHEDLEIVIPNNKHYTVYTLGLMMKFLHNALKNTEVYAKHFDFRTELIDEINQSDFTESVILVKGSRGMKMEDFVKILEEKYR